MRFEQAGIGEELLLTAPDEALGLIEGFEAGDTISVGAIAGGTITAQLIGDDTAVTFVAGGAALGTLDLFGTYLPADLDFDAATGRLTTDVRYGPADPVIGSTAVTLANRHVGDVDAGTVAIGNSGYPSFTEVLDAGWSSASAAITTGGTASLAAGTSADLTIGVTTTAAGALAGTATLALISDGTTIDGLGTTALPSQTITVIGSVYAYADPLLNSGTISFANAHVGTAGTQALTITDATTDAAFTEDLDAGFGASTSGVTTSGSITLAAGATNTSGLTIGLSSTTAGLQIGTAVLSLISDGTTIDGLGTTSLPSQTVTATGAFYAYADAVLSSGTDQLRQRTCRHWRYPGADDHQRDHQRGLRRRPRCRVRRVDVWRDHVRERRPRGRCG